MTSPFGPLVLIVNPKSGRGKVRARLPEVERRLRDDGLDYRIVPTIGPGHATRAAREALEGGERFIVAAGGDGTIHEVVNGMIEDDGPVAPDAVLGVVAAGSGSDFVRSFGLPGDAVRATDHLAGDRTCPIDVGKVTFASGAGETTTRYFPNIAEAGLGGSVVSRAARLPRALGPSQYFFGFWLTLPSFQRATISVEADGAAAYRGPAFNVVVANCRFYGGGMQISPKSAWDDGMLDVLLMVGPKREAFTTLPKVYRGTHLPHPNIRELHGWSIRVESDQPLAVEADGEGLGTTPATFAVIPGALRLKI